MGGLESGNTSETIIEGVPSSQPGFTMQYRTEYACSIPDKTTNSLIITGGWNTLHRVSRYSTAGFLEDLPDLNEGRASHGCGAYQREDGTPVFLVTGGFYIDFWDDDGDVLSSTEVLVST